MPKFKVSNKYNVQHYIHNETVVAGNHYINEKLEFIEETSTKENMCRNIIVLWMSFYC